MKDPLNIPLHQFQQWMQQLLLDPFQQTPISPIDLLPESVQQHSTDQTGINTVVESTTAMDATQHLSIYQRGYIARLRNCMMQQFSALEYALGEDIFIAFADAYLASKPSTHYNLGELGRDFPAFIQENRPDASEELKEDWIDFIIELARFEFDFSVLFDQKGDENYRGSTIETPDHELILRDVCQVFEFQFPIGWYYVEFKKDTNPHLPHLHTSYSLVLRHNYQMTIYELHPEQFAFLQLMKKGKTLKAAKEAYIRLFPEQADSLETVLPEWKNYWMRIHLLREV